MPAPSAMKAQLAHVKEMIPGILVRHPIGNDASQTRSYPFQGLFRFGAGEAVHAQCQELQDRLNRDVAPEAIVGKVSAPRGTLRCAIPSLGDKAFGVPIGAGDAADLYARLDPSLVGVELRGDVLDTDLRRSHEVLASLVRLPGCLAKFEFPEEVRRIHESLCPSAEAIRVEPYKLILYGTGDFFVPHRDSMDREDMFGTISLCLPIALAAEEGAAVEREEAPDGRRDLSPTAASEQPGQLILHVGMRASDRSINEGTAEGVKQPSNVLTYVVDMDSVNAAAAGGGGPGEAVVMSYGAWTGDVLHEVRPVASGHRAVLTYRLYKQGHRESYIPASLRDPLEAQVRGIVSALAGLALPEESREGGTLPAHCYLGFALRHAYPVAGLKPRCLKGVDAVAYSIASGGDESAVVLFTGYQCRPQDFTSVHELSRDLYRAGPVFVTTDYPDRDLFGSEEARNVMARAYPTVANTLWVSLGYGALLGGGFCYGNADCGTDWWYRQAFMLVARPNT